MKCHLFRAGALAGIALAIGAGPLRSADPLPKAETILDRYIEVTGGRAAYQRHHTQMITGSMEVAGAEIRGKATFYSAEPDNSVSVLDIAGMGTILEGTDGKVAWSFSAMQGPRIKEGEERTAALREASFNNHLRWRELYQKAQLVGVETLDGKECYKVLLTPAGGNPVTRYYESQSGLLVKSTTTVKTPTGDIPVESMVSDYRPVDGVQVPYKMVQKAAGQTIAVSVESVQFNGGIPPGRFDLPEEVRALELVKK